MRLVRVKEQKRIMCLCKRGLNFVSVILIIWTFMICNIVGKEALKDVREIDWFYENINVLVDEGIINGYPDGTFKPNETINRDAFIKTMVVALGYEVDNGEGYWAKPYIDKALELGIIKSGSEENYRQVITREEMSKIVIEVVGILEGDKSFQYDTVDSNFLLESIGDMSQVSDDEAKIYISKAYELGIITGYPDRTFKPKGSLKRSEACTVIRRVIDSSARRPFVPKELSQIEMELTEENGYMPLTSRSDDISIIYTDEMLNSDNGELLWFRSGLRYVKNNYDGHWKISYNAARANKKDEFNMQIYEIAYILKSVFHVDDASIIELKEHLLLKKGRGVNVREKEFYTKDNRKYRARFSFSFTSVVEIVGFESDEE